MRKRIDWWDVEGQVIPDVEAAMGSASQGDLAMFARRIGATTPAARPTPTRQVQNPRDSSKPFTIRRPYGSEPVNTATVDPLSPRNLDEAFGILSSSNSPLWAPILRATGVPAREVGQMVADEARRSGTGPLGAGGRAAGRAVAPTAASLPALGAGARAGASLPLPPLMRGVAALGLGGLAAMGAGGAASSAQDRLMRFVLGDDGYASSKAQEAQDVASQPTAVMLGQNLPGMAFGSPVGGLGERALSAAGNVGLGAAQTLATGGDYGLPQLALDASMGALLPRNNRLGGGLMGAGDAAMGRTIDAATDPVNQIALAGATRNLLPRLDAASYNWMRDNGLMGNQLNMGAAPTKKPPKEIPTLPSMPATTDPRLTGLTRNTDQALKDYLLSGGGSRKISTGGFDRARYGWYVPRHEDSLVPDLFVQGGTGFFESPEYGPGAATASNASAASTFNKAIEKGADAFAVGLGQPGQFTSTPQFGEAYAWEIIDELLGGKGMKGPRNSTISMSKIQEAITAAVKPASDKLVQQKLAAARGLAAKVGKTLTDKDIADITKRNEIPLPVINTPEDLVKWMVDGMTITERGVLIPTLGAPGKAGIYGLPSWQDVGAGYVDPRYGTGRGQLNTGDIIAMSAFDQQNPGMFRLPGHLAHGSYDSILRGMGLQNFARKPVPLELLTNDSSGDFRTSPVTGRRATGPVNTWPIMSRGATVELPPSDVQRLVDIATGAPSRGEPNAVFLDRPIRVNPRPTDLTARAGVGNLERHRALFDALNRRATGTTYTGPAGGDAGGGGGEPAPVRTGGMGSDPNGRPVGLPPVGGEGGAGLPDAPGRSASDARGSADGAGDLAGVGGGLLTPTRQPDGTWTFPDREANGRPAASVPIQERLGAKTGDLAGADDRPLYDRLAESNDPTQRAALLAAELRAGGMQEGAVQHAVRTVFGPVDMDAVDRAAAQIQVGPPRFQTAPPAPHASLYPADEARARMAAKAAMKPGQGAPKNPTLVMRSKDGTVHVIGQQDFTQWASKHRANLTDAQIADYARFYQDFPKYFGPQAGGSEGAALAWLIGNKSTAGPQVTRHLLEAEDAMVGRMPPRGKVHSFQDTSDAMMAAMRGEPLPGSVGQKLSDFTDSAYGRPTRTFFGDDPRAGAPHTGDIWSFRDHGFVDVTRLRMLPSLVGGTVDTPNGPVRIAAVDVRDKGRNRGATIHLENGDSIPIVLDGESPSPDQYEWMSQRGNEWFQGSRGDQFWEGAIGNPADAQAVGWSGTSTAFGTPASGIADSLFMNTPRISFELEPDPLSPLGKNLGTIRNLPPEAQARVTRRVLDDIVSQVEARVKTAFKLKVDRTVGGSAFENGARPSFHVSGQMSPETAKLVAAHLGAALGQRENYIMRFLLPGEGRKDKPRYVAFEVPGMDLSSQSNADAVYRVIQQAAPKLAQGFSVIRNADGSTSMVIANDKRYGKWGKDEWIYAQMKVVEEALKRETGTDVKTFSDAIRFDATRNDWEADPTGSGHFADLVGSTDWGEAEASWNRDNLGRAAEQAFRAALDAERGQPGTNPDLAGAYSGGGPGLTPTRQPDGTWTFPDREADGRPAASVPIQERLGAKTGDLAGADPSGSDWWNLGSTLNTGLGPTPKGPAALNQGKPLIGEGSRFNSDFTAAHSLLSPLSVVGANGETLARGTYERIGGAPGRAISDLLREAQVEAAGSDSPSAVADALAKRRTAIELQLKLLERGQDRSSGGFPARQFTPDGAPKPGLVQEIRRHLDDLARKPKKYEESYGRLMKAILGDRLENPDYALRAHTDRLMRVGNTLRLRYNVKSALVNLAQPLETLWPYVSSADYAAMAAEYAKPSTRKRLADMGVLESSKVEGEQPQPSTSKIPATIRDPFGAASAVNRGMGYLYGEMAAKRAGVTDPKEIHKSGLAWAEKVEFDNSAFNAPPILRDTLARFVLQYKGFTVKSLENLLGPDGLVRGDAPPAQRLARVGKWFAAKGMVGGVKALGGPAGAGLAATVFLTAREMARDQGAEEEVAEQVGIAAALGLPTLLGADVSGSVGVLDAPFGNSDSEKIVNFAMGPTVGTALNLKRFADRTVKEGQLPLPSDALALGKQLSPYIRAGEGISNLYQKFQGGDPTVEVPQTEGGTENLPLTWTEAVAGALGATNPRRSMGYVLREQSPEAKERAAERAEKAREKRQRKADGPMDPIEERIMKRYSPEAIERRYAPRLPKL